MHEEQMTFGSWLLLMFGLNLGKKCLFYCVCILCLDSLQSGLKMSEVIWREAFRSKSPFDSDCFFN